MTYSEPRAKHDAKVREKKLQKLRQQVGDRAPSKTLMPKDKSKFLTLTHAGYVELDEAAIAADAQWDGLHAIVTNAENPLPETELLAQYKQLWQIEDCFRTTKHDLNIRPVYHYTDPRIHAHLAICYMGFVAYRNSATDCAIAAYTSRSAISFHNSTPRTSAISKPPTTNNSSSSHNRSGKISKPSSARPMCIGRNTASRYREFETVTNP